MEDLIEACSDALYEYEGIDKGVSRRTVQMDIQMMRSEKLGYNAPIEVVDKKYYTYTDPDYSITNIPLTDQDLGKLSEVVDILRQFKGFTHFNELNGMVQRLEDRINTARSSQPGIIDLEKNENLRGLDHLDSLYQAILKKKCLKLSYQSFKARQANTFNFHSYLLKEYRNRWFVLGKKKSGQPLITLALDRILAIEDNDQPYLPNDFPISAEYFRDVIGVTVNEGQAPEEVLLFVDAYNAPYIVTKPLHHSQQLVESSRNGIVIRLNVQHNFELERVILGYGDAVKVLAPQHLRRRIQSSLKNALDGYERELSSKEQDLALKKFQHKGYAVLDHVYSRKELRKLNKLLERYLQHKKGDRGSVDQLLQKLPKLKDILLNDNLCGLIREGFGEGYSLSKATFLDAGVASKQFSGWQQQSAILEKEKPQEEIPGGVIIRIHLDDTQAENGALRLIPQSHGRQWNEQELLEISSEKDAVLCTLKSGSIHMLKPLTVHAFIEATSQKPCRVIQLEFYDQSGLEDMQWEESIAVE